eukprot:3518758-Amphidinium_carterae.3
MWRELFSAAGLAAGRSCGGGTIAALQTGKTCDCWRLESISVARRLQYWWSMSGSHSHGPMMGECVTMDKALLFPSHFVVQPEIEIVRAPTKALHLESRVDEAEVLWSQRWEECLKNTTGREKQCQWGRGSDTYGQHAHAQDSAKDRAKGRRPGRELVSESLISTSDTEKYEAKFDVLCGQCWWTTENSSGEDSGKVKWHCINYFVQQHTLEIQRWRFENEKKALRDWKLRMQDYGTACRYIQAETFRHLLCVEDSSVADMDATLRQYWTSIAAPVGLDLARAADSMHEMVRDAWEPQTQSCLPPISVGDVEGEEPSATLRKRASDMLEDLFHDPRQIVERRLSHRQEKRSELRL